MERISLKEVIQLLFSGEPCTLEVVKYDANRRKGGSIRVYENVRLNYSLEKSEIKTNDKTNHDIDTQMPNTPVYRPKPFINVVLPNGDLRKIYRVLIIKCNNKTVLI